MKILKVLSSAIIVFLLCSVILTGCGPSVPAAPILVSATPGNGQVTIAWTAVSGAAYYNIYWSTTYGVTPVTGTLITDVAAGATTPSFTQQGLSNGTAYYYVVTAVNGGGGESGASNEISATPMLPVSTDVSAPSADSPKEP